MYTVVDIAAQLTKSSNIYDKTSISLELWERLFTWSSIPDEHKSSRAFPQHGGWRRDVTIPWRHQQWANHVRRGSKYDKWRANELSKNAFRQERASLDQATRTHVKSCRFWESQVANLSNFVALTKARQKWMNGRRKVKDKNQCVCLIFLSVYRIVSFKAAVAILFV